jgi:VWFA-related protein
VDRRLSLGVTLALWLLAATRSVAQEEPREPVEVGLEEQVEVRLVLIDAVVLDRKDRTVPGLGREDFELRVDGRPVEIVSLDTQCPLDAAEDVRGGSSRNPPSPPGQASEPPRVVLVVDYFHVHSAALALDAAREALERWPDPDGEHMVVSLGAALRIELPFTCDRDAVQATLARMRQDRGLYAGHHGHLTEWPFFDRLGSLFDLLERLPGRKVVVLFSGPFARDGFDHDTAYERLAGLSAMARTAVYPVDTGGLRTPLDPHSGPLGGPRKLHRLAIETGGRMTADTNDLGLAYVRAQRDLGCTYTLGFHDPRPRLDDRRRLAIHVRTKDGLRAVHPSSYVLRSPEAKRRSLTRTASMAPEMFPSDALTARLVLERPLGSSRWAALLTVELRGSGMPVRALAEGRLRGFLRRPSGTIVRTFDRSVREPEGAGAGLRFEERLSLAPGRYRIGAVFSGPGLDSPLATSREIDVPELPASPPGGPRRQRRASRIPSRSAARTRALPSRRRPSSSDVV